MLAWTKLLAHKTRAKIRPAQLMETKPIRYALIGAGSAARTHLREIGKKHGVEVVGIADSAEPKLWRISGDYASVPRFTDNAELLSVTQPDLVSICTPNKFHCELTLLALRAGAHVACEKPMAMTVAEAEKMEAERAAAGKLGSVNFSYRNVMAFRFARELIANRELGRLMRVNVVYLQSFLGVQSTSWSWRNDVGLAGFGALGDLGVHLIDSVRFVTGLEFRQVVGLAQTLIPEKWDVTGKARPVTTDTNAAFLGELEGAVVATFEATQIAPGYGDFFRLEVSGEAGTLVVNSERPDEIRLRNGASLTPDTMWKTDLPREQLPVDFAGRNTPTSPGAIVHAIRGACVEFPTFADGVAAQRVLGALIRSMETRAWVDVG